MSEIDDIKEDLYQGNAIAEDEQNKIIHALKLQELVNEKIKQSKKREASFRIDLQESKDDGDTELTLSYYYGKIGEETGIQNTLLTLLEQSQNTLQTKCFMGDKN